MNPREILEHFRLLSGLTLEEAELWLGICGQCALKLRQKLRDPALEQENAVLLSAAAAELAYAKYVEICASRESESFSAGDITIRGYGEGAVKAAKSVAREAVKAISHLLTDQEFLFRRCKN